LVGYSSRKARSSSSRKRAWHSPGSRCRAKRTRSAVPRRWTLSRRTAGIHGW
jgi:hypothetical protein